MRVVTHVDIYVHNVELSVVVCAFCLIVIVRFVCCVVCLLLCPIGPPYRVPSDCNGGVGCCPIVCQQESNAQ